MTKLFSILAVAVIATSFVSCGPSAEEKAKMEEAAKHAGDSIAAALSESLNAAMETATVSDSTTTSTSVETTTTTTEATSKH